MAEAAWGLRGIADHAGPRGGSPDARSDHGQGGLMLVVADSSPVILLVNIGQIGVIGELFGHAVIPPEVSAELRAAQRPRAVREFIASPPSWLTERAAKAI